MHQWIEAIDFPAVIAAAHINDLRHNNSVEIPQQRADFVRGYLGFDEHARFALENLIGSLANSNHAGAFFINGVFGSGKSHLLGVLTLLGENIGRDDFADIHPFFAEQLQKIPPRFVVYFSLDEYDGTKYGLEEITYREISKQAKLSGFTIQLPDISERISRSERFSILEEQLKSHGFAGLQLCVDELSLFLGTKDHRALQAEASWLQFLGQRCARDKSTFSYWSCFALQKDWEDVGDIEPYSLAQVRDRYRTLTLSLAHLPAIIEQRLLRRRNVEKIQISCRESYRKLRQIRPQIDFGIAEWESLYPFHPAAVQLLAEVASRFFSRTRSAVQFCAAALRQYIREGNYNARITAEQVFDYFRPEFGQFVELRPLDRVWRQWQESIPRIARDNTEKRTYEILLKKVLLFRLGGRSVTAISLGNTINSDFELQGDDNYRFIHQLLARWCEQSDHLVREAGETWQQDQFSVNLGLSVKRAVHRLTRHSLEKLQEYDARVIAHLLESCDDAEFPLRQLLANSMDVTVNWHNSLRALEVALWQRDTAQQLSNQLTRNAQNAIKVLLYLGVPLKPILPLEIGDEMHQLSPRIRAALLIWQPRLPTEDERNFIRETVARVMLRDDPGLRDNRRGRSILRYLERDIQQRTAEMRKTVFRLYAEGTIQSGDQRSVDVAELCYSQSWKSMLRQIAAFALEAVFPQYPKVAASKKVLSPTQTRQLGEKLLHQDSEKPWWPASLNRPVQAIAAPLGLAKDDKGKRKYAAGHKDLTQSVENFLGDQALPIRAIYRHLAASEWGLQPLQSDLLLCGMLASGKLEAIDTAGKVLLLTTLRPPLEKSIHAVRQVTLLDEPAWESVKNTVQILCGQQSRQHDFAQQMQAAAWLREWAQKTQIDANLTRSRLHQLRQIVENDAALWRKTQEILSGLEQLTTHFASDSNASILEFAAELERVSLRALATNWNALKSTFEEDYSLILQTCQKLYHPQLVAPEELRDLQKTLQESFARGEKVLFEEQFRENARRWNRILQEKYREWHQRQYQNESWRQLRDISNGRVLIALGKLAKLPRYPFPESVQLLEKIANAQDKFCGRNGELLAGNVACDQCNLPYGHQITPPDITKFRTKLNDALRQFYGFLHSENIAARLQCDDAGFRLLEWDGNGENLLSLLNAETLAALQKAMEPRLVYNRSAKVLLSQIGGRWTRAELENIFKEWLEARDIVAPDDEIIIVDLPTEN